MLETSFTTLPLSPEFLANLNSLNYKEMTDIQGQSLPFILNGKDIRAQAKTGTGKTAAFGIGLLHNLDVKTYQTQALILCPTRELADQVSKEIRRLARSTANTKIVTLCGGTPMHPQLNSLERHPHIVVGTPGRILKHLKKGSLDLNNLKTLVLDEADRMLDMGFYDDIMSIIKKIPKKRQTLLFSATFSDEIKTISDEVQKDPVDISVELIHDDEMLQQVFFEVNRDTKLEALISLLKHYHPESSVIFCNRKQQCKDLAYALQNEGLHALALHGDLEQKERNQVLTQFSNKSSSILIATDVAARGLDIKDLQAVINFELSPDAEIHIHRIGRTGRAGNKGLAVSLFTASESFRIDAIENYQGQPVTIGNLSTLKDQKNFNLIPPMVTLLITAGRKNKIRPGDILGALTASTNLPGKQIGKIDIFDTLSYVAVERSVASTAEKVLLNGKIKGRKYKVHTLP